MDSLAYISDTRKTPVGKWVLGVSIQVLLGLLYAYDNHIQITRDAIETDLRLHENCDPIAEPAAYKTAPSRQALRRIINRPGTYSYYVQRLAMRLIDTNTQLNQCVDSYHRLVRDFRVLCDTDPTCLSQAIPVTSMPNGQATLMPLSNPGVENDNVCAYPISECSVKYCSDGAVLRPLVGACGEPMNHDIGYPGDSCIGYGEVDTQYLNRDISVQAARLVQCQQAVATLSAEVIRLTPTSIEN